MVAGAFAQGGTWFGTCWDPQNDNPLSDDWGYNIVRNQLFEATMGGSGTVTWGGQNGPCFAPAVTGDVAGRIGFRIGTLGSRHSTFDDGMALTMGFPTPTGSWSAASIIKGNAQAFFGASGLSLFYPGASDRYMLAEGTENGVFVRCRIDLVGDAARINWTLVNTEADTQNLGLWFGQWVEMITPTGQVAGGFGKNPYVFVPGRKPLRVESEIERAADVSTYPDYVNFDFGQTNAYGLKVVLGPGGANASTSGVADATQSDWFSFGEKLFLTGGNNATSFPNLPPKDFFVDSPAYLVQYDPVPVATQDSRTIIQYFRSTWSAANYVKPYAVIVDAPKLIASDPNGLNKLAPNPFVVRVYVDNIRGYSTIDQEVTLNEVKVKLTFAAGSGLKFAPGQNSQVTIDRILPRGIGFADFRVQSDGKTIGPVIVNAVVSPTPGPVKTVPATIILAGTPRLGLKPKANLVSIPFKFDNSGLDKVLGLKVPVDFQAFSYSPQQRGYILQSSAQRAKGYWIVYNKTTEADIELQSNPTIPADTATGAPNIVLKSGWNLIGNPYNYTFPLGQITGVSGSNPDDASTWASLVSQGIIGGALAWYDTTSSSYKYVEGVDSLLVPNRGYWIYVNTSEDLTLAFPPVFQEFLPNSPLSAEVRPIWKLGIGVKSNGETDDQNFIGQVVAANQIQKLTRAKPPISPVGTLNAYFTGPLNGKNAALSQVMKVRGKQTFDMTVTSVKGGTVRVEWPGIGTVPATVKLSIRDTATNIVRDLRKFPAIAFIAKKGESRKLVISVE
jgi:hypothetical protein